MTFGEKIKNLRKSKHMNQTQLANAIGVSLRTIRGWEIEGRYPNYNSVIPQENPFKVTIDRISFLNALKRVSVFSNPASSLVKLQLKENEMLVSAQDIDFSTSAEETQVCQYSGAAMSIGFKSTFLIDILNNISADEVVIELADPSRAGVIVPVEQEENEDLLMLLMPMMLND